MYRAHEEAFQTHKSSFTPLVFVDLPSFFLFYDHERCETGNWPQKFLGLEKEQSPPEREIIQNNLIHRRNSIWGPPPPAHEDVLYVCTSRTNRQSEQASVRSTKKDGYLTRIVLPDPLLRSRTPVNLGIPAYMTLEIESTILKRLRYFKIDAGLIELIFFLFFSNDPLALVCFL